MNAIVTTIKSYHAHIYYNDSDRDGAEKIRLGLDAEFNVTLGRWHDAPVGPHTGSMYQVAFAASEFDKVVPWLMLNRHNLDILVHPETGNDLADHTEYAFWLGNKRDLFTEKLK